MAQQKQLERGLASELLTKANTLSAMHSMIEKHQYRHALVALLIGLCTACGHQIKTTSSDGRNACLAKVESEIGIASPQQKQAALRQCLKTIDQELAERAAQAAQENKAEEEAMSQAQAAQEARWDSPQERYQYCKFNQPDVISLEKERIRIYARLNAAESPSSRSGDSTALQEQYDDIINQLNNLLPERMRAGWPLIPEAVNRFRQCDPSDFGIKR